MTTPEHPPIGKYIENFLKIILAITAFMAVSIFSDMREELSQLRQDVASIRERLSFIEGQLKYNK
jgi:hypothetical protein